MNCMRISALSNTSYGVIYTIAKTLVLYPNEELWFFVDTEDLKICLNYRLPDEKLYAYETNSDTQITFPNVVTAREIADSINDLLFTTFANSEYC